MIKILKLLLFLFITSSFSLYAQNKISDLKAKDFLEDFDLMVKIIKKQHPNPYAFIESKEFDKKVDSLRNLLNLKPNIYNFINYSPKKLIGDVHLLQTASDEFLFEICKPLSYFPLPVYIEKRKMFVNIKGYAIPFGAEIININNRTVQSILKDLARGNSDGYIPTGVDGISSDFGRLFSFLYPDVKSYTITYIVHEGEEAQKKVLNSIDYASYYYNNAKSVMPYNLLETSLSNIYGNTIEEKKTGVLTVNTFYIDESDAYKKFSSFFKDINQRKYKNLIIDIRNNRGGDPGIAALLYSFISKAEFLNEYNFRTKTIELAYPEHIVVNGRNASQDDILDFSNFMYQRFDKDTLSDFYIGNNRLNEGFIRNYPKDKDAFSGDVYVLIGSQTISAATYFASLVKMNNRGVIVGKETASGIDATRAGWFLNYKLPKTNIILVMPRSEIYFFNASKDRGRGLMPDKEIKTSLFYKYMIEGKDPEMNYTFDLINLFHNKSKPR